MCRMGLTWHGMAQPNQKRMSSSVSTTQEQGATLPLSMQDAGRKMQDACESHGLLDFSQASLEATGIGVWSARFEARLTQCRLAVLG